MAAEPHNLPPPPHRNHHGPVSRPSSGWRRVLNFLEPDLGPLEDEYRRHFLPADISQALAANGIAILASLFFVYIDYRFFGLGDNFTSLLVLRGVLLAVAIIMYQVLAQTREPRTADRLVLLSEIIIIISAVYVNASRPPAYWQGPVIDVLLILSFYTLIPQPLAARLLAGVGFSLLSGGVLIYTKVGIPSLTLLIMLAALVMANLLGLLVSTRLFNYRRSQYKSLVDQRSAQAALEYLATTDSLTGIFNRRSFMAAAQQELARYRRHQRPFSIVSLDLDHFKNINDTYGHQTGDQALRAFADLVSRVGRREDTFGRVGGEEFGLLLPETGLAEALQAAERLRRHCQALDIKVDDGHLPLTFSAGVAEVGPGDADLDSLMRRADRALYRAKQAGRNRIEVMESVEL